MGLLTEVTTVLSSASGFTTSVFSAAAAFLAWKSKLQFADEFKEATKAKIALAEQMVDHAKVQKDIEIERIRAGLVKDINEKDIEINYLKARIDILERDTAEVAIARFKEMKEAYEIVIADLPKLQNLVSSDRENQVLNKKINVFEDRLSALGDELNWMAKFSKDAMESREIAKEWLETNANTLTQEIYKYTKARYPNLDDLCNADAPKYGIRVFFWDIEEYIQIIGHCLVTNRTNLIDQHHLTLSLPEPYRIAFGHLRRQIPPDLPGDASIEIRKIVDYLLAFVADFYHLKS